jgi:predicted acyltransferase
MGTTTTTTPTTTTTILPQAAVTPDSLLQGKRLVSLDAFRGLTIAAMILVNDPGTWSAVYPPLLHATWHGWTPTDLVFPFFLFIVGVAVAFAYQKRLARGVEKGPMVLKALKRSLVLFGLGLLLAAYPFFNFSPEFALRDFGTLRIPGVLQRIAVCYLVVTLLFLYAKPRWEYVIAAVILFGYWAAMTLIPVPGYGAGMLDEPAATLAGYLDRVVFGDHLWSTANREWDPEGFLSTFPAVVTTLIGVWTGRLLLSSREPIDKTVRILMWGLAALTAGYVWNWFFPINKSLWTSSYVLLSGGLAMCGLGICYWIADVRGRDRWTRPFVEYGVNAITVYVLSGLLVRTILTIRLPQVDGSSQSLQSWIFANIFAPLGPPQLASLLYAIVWVLGFYLIAHWMYRRNIIIKV